MKVKTRPSRKPKEMPTCPRCGQRQWRKAGLLPTNPQASTKGYHNERHEHYYKEAMDRLFTKRYVCQKCGKKRFYGNAGKSLIGD